MITGRWSRNPIRTNRPPALVHDGAVGRAQISRATGADSAFGSTRRCIRASPRRDKAVQYSWPHARCRPQCGHGRDVSLTRLEWSSRASDSAMRSSTTATLLPLPRLARSSGAFGQYPPRLRLFILKAPCGVAHASILTRDTSFHASFPARNIGTRSPVLLSFSAIRARAVRYTDAGACVPCSHS